MNEQEKIIYNPMSSTRGFVTLATGDEKYYRYARNLLYSYRLHNVSLPFAILCDRENEYTREFDKVVVLKDTTATYSDKFRVLVDSPYDETVFIESDCLVYHNLEEMFRLLSSGDDFTAFGVNDDDIKVWFSKPEQLKEKYGGLFSSIPVFNPGYFFVRKSELTQKIYRDTKEVSDWLIQNRPDDGKIALFCNDMLRDDVVFSMVMKLNGCRCVAHPSVGKCIFYPNTKKIRKISVIKGQLDVTQDKEYNDCNILHFSSRRCKEEALYFQEQSALKKYYHNRSMRSALFFESRLVYCCVYPFKKLRNSFRKNNGTTISCTKKCDA